MTRKERLKLYDELTSVPKKSGKYTFIFDPPNDYSFLCNFHVMKGSQGVFVSDYLIKKIKIKTLIRIKVVSDKTILGVVINTSSKKIPIDVQGHYWQLTMKDFLYLLSNGLWVVGEIKPQK